jgi:hypothetical protein
LSDFWKEDLTILSTALLHDRVTLEELPENLRFNQGFWTDLIDESSELFLKMPDIAKESMDCDFSFTIAKLS